MTRARLITIPFSHFCEKARWGLDRAGVPYDEEHYLPLLHFLGTSLRGRSRTTPILIEAGARAIGDSTKILLALEERTPEALRLHGAGAARDEAIALEEELDAAIGPGVRRLAYHHLIRHDRAGFVETLTEQGPAWQKSLVRTVPGLIATGLDRGLGLGDAATARSEAKLDATLAKIDARMRGRPAASWLLGDRFTCADLTLAALLAPMLAPPEHPFPYLARERLPPALAAIVGRVRSSVAGELALRAYREERARSPAALLT